MNTNLNDGTGDPPKLRVYLNTDTLTDLPDDSIWPGAAGTDAVARIREDGFEGLQFGESDSLTPAHAGAFPYCGLDRINRPEEADAVFSRHKARGDSCVTLHLGWGIEKDDEIDRLVEAVLSAADRHSLPGFVETHRATITQDMWRTVQLTERFPEIRFNADFSHYYCGQEMVYGDFETKLNFLDPLFERVAFMHGRIAAPGYMQAPIQSTDARPKMAVGVDYLAHFKELWRRALAGFRRNARSGDVLVFAPEILRSDIYYARVFPDATGQLHEETDRYREALLYAEIIRNLFDSIVLERGR